MPSESFFVVVVLLTVWPCGGQRLRGCPRETLSITAFVPCISASDPAELYACDKFVHSAAQLAADHLNALPSLLTNVTVNITAMDGQNVRQCIYT